MTVPSLSYFWWSLRFWEVLSCGRSILLLCVLSLEDSVARSLISVFFFPRSLIISSFCLFHSPEVFQRACIPYFTQLQFFFLCNSPLRSSYLLVCFQKLHTRYQGTYLLIVPQFGVYQWLWLYLAQIKQTIRVTFGLWLKIDIKTRTHNELKTEVSPVLWMLKNS